MTPSSIRATTILPFTRTPTGRPRLIALLLLAAVAFLCQGLYSKYVIDLYRDPAARSRIPFRYAVDRTVSNVNDEAALAGLGAGDLILTVNDKAFDGAAMLNKVLSTSRPGDIVRVGSRHADGRLFVADIRLVAVGSSSYRLRDWMFAIVALLLVPALA